MLNIIDNFSAKGVPPERISSIDPSTFLKRPGSEPPTVSEAITGQVEFFNNFFGMRPCDQLVIYFNGHGGKTGVAIKDPNQPEVNLLLRPPDLKDALNKANAKHIKVILETCSGEFFFDDPQLDNAHQELKTVLQEIPGLQWIFVSSTGDGKGAGYRNLDLTNALHVKIGLLKIGSDFTNALLDAWTGTVSLPEAFAKAAKEVKNQDPKIFLSLTNTPVTEAQLSALPPTTPEAPLSNVIAHGIVDDTGPSDPGNCDGHVQSAAWEITGLRFLYAYQLECHCFPNWDVGYVVAGIPAGGGLKVPLNGSKLLTMDFNNDGKAEETSFRINHAGPFVADLTAMNEGDDFAIDPVGDGTIAAIHMGTHVEFLNADGIFNTGDVVGFVTCSPPTIVFGAHLGGSTTGFNLVVPSGPCE